MASNILVSAVTSLVVSLPYWIILCIKRKKENEFSEESIDYLKARMDSFSEHWGSWSIADKVANFRVTLSLFEPLRNYVYKTKDKSKVRYFENRFAFLVLAGEYLRIGDYPRFEKAIDDAVLQSWPDPITKK